MLCVLSRGRLGPSCLGKTNSVSKPLLQPAELPNVMDLVCIDLEVVIELTHNKHHNPCFFLNCEGPMLCQKIHN